MGFVLGKNSKKIRKAKVDGNSIEASTATFLNGGVNRDYDYENVVMMNDGIEICAKACAVCWDTKLPASADAKSKYIGKRTKIGHTSVIEHSNLVIYMEINVEKHYGDIIDLLSHTKYLNTCFKMSRINKDKGYLIIGGSWRAFADLYKVMDNLNNCVLARITNVIKTYIPCDGLRDIVDAGIMDEIDFANFSTYSPGFNVYGGKVFAINDDIDCINCDDINTLMHNIRELCLEHDLFTVFDLLPFCTITINFKNMSRIITQQLTRHRNGITQESQRYVDYSNGSFNSPAKFRPDLYDEKHKYTVTFAGTTKQLTLQELGDAIISIYGQLTDRSPNKAAYALNKEDARGYLPSNVKCGTIYITFTWKSFMSFLYLREDPHAQAEFRGYAIALGKWFRSIYPEFADAIYESVKPFICIDEESILKKHLASSTPKEDSEEDNKELLLGNSFEEIISEHIESYDESKEDVIEEEPGDTVLRHGEM